MLADPLGQVYSDRQLQLPQLKEQEVGTTMNMSVPSAPNLKKKIYIGFALSIALVSLNAFRDSRNRILLGSLGLAGRCNHI